MSRTFNIYCDESFTYHIDRLSQRKIVEEETMRWF